MTPEKNIETIVRGVCLDSGHWPYTQKSDLFIGYKPAGETPMMASDRIMRMQVRYDLIIIARRSAKACEMETLRYRLYAALLRGGWKFDGDPGPETYDNQGDRFLWPVSVVKSFAIDSTGMPADPMALINGGET